MKKNFTAAILLMLMMAFFAASCSSSDDNGLLPDGDNGTDGDVDGDQDASITIPYVVVSGSVAIEVGDTITLEAQTINGEDSGYTWGSTDEVIATVDENGVVTGVAAGEASITATGKDSDKTGSWGVYVYVLPEEGSSKVTISGEVALKIGDTTTLTAETEGEEDSGYTWESSDEAKATIDENGLVTGVAAGEVIITATGADSGESGQWGMYIYAPAVEIPTVSVSGGYSVIVGMTLALTAATTGGTDSAYTWVSSSDAVATVDAASGVVTGVSAGEVTITATGVDTNVSGEVGIVVINPEQEIPYEDLWKTSGHADSTSEAFRHWDEDGTVPTNCAKCHSTYGYLDFLGEDGTAAGTVENEAATDSVVSCIACHNQSTAEKTSVVFPSGMMVEDLDASARCMECHQGRESTVSVNDSITASEVADDDTVDEDLRFKNVHYAAAGATISGNEAMGAYQYDGKSYDGMFAHVENVDSCVSCHDSHTLEVKSESCATCHADRSDYKDIRMAGSMMDYDGDGNISEGIYYEIEGLRELLYDAIQAYADEVAGTALIYDAASYPYFFADANANGTVDEGEGAYNTWTARLVKATYNYQYSLKDTGAFAHNAKYVIEVLFDSIEDLNTAIDTPVALEGERNDSGHFDSTAEAWRHWDEDPSVSSSCAKCHSAEGLPFYLEHGVNFDQPQAAAMACATCHDDVTGGDFSSQYLAESVLFPSGSVIDSGSNSSNICMQCHQGRESSVSVDSYIASKVPEGDTMEEDIVYTGLGFRNVHYLAAGATRYGSEAKGGYEYEGQVYDGFFEHVSSASQCTDCHNTHNQTIKLDACVSCHEGLESDEDLKDIRMASSTIDYNGNEDTAEGIYYEIEGLQEKLYEAIQAYAAEAIGPYIIYSAASYPYWFIDTNENGLVDSGETTNANKYAEWTPRLVKATYNYQYSLKDPGAFAHNAKYVIELLFDSITNLNSVLSTPIEFGVSRNDSGHFDPTSEAWRHWDEDGAVQASCARCHSGAGLDYYATNGTNPTEAVPASWGLTCENCHSSIGGDDREIEAPVKYMATAVFPSGTTINNNAEDPDNSFLCLTCHVGRESKTSVDAAITAGSYGFKNVHYAPAGSTLYGADAHVGYEYTGKTYQTKFTHGSGSASADCAYCHSIEGEAHHFEPELKDDCLDCHDEATAGNIESIRKNRSGDYNGNNNTTEPLADEVNGLIQALYLQMQSYCTNTLSSSIVYDANAYPYFFKDTNGNGLVDAGEATNANKYTAWNASLMKAAFNFQFAKKEAGGWAHNTKYVVQLLIDSIEDLGGDVDGYTRP